VTAPAAEIHPPTGQVRLGLGCMALTGIYGPVDRATAVATIHRALDLGVDHFDTAELYGPFINESFLADALGDQRHRVSIATKVGYRLEEGRIVGLDSRPQHIRTAVEGSLRRLRREAVDLLYQHRPDPSVPVEEVVGAMADLLQAGKVRALGLSATDPLTFQRAQQVHPIAAVQNEYSLLERNADTEFLDLVADAGATFFSYSPLGRGHLAGTGLAAERRSEDDYRRKDTRFSEVALKAARVVLAPLKEIAETRGVEPATVALAWILDRHPALRVIPGARSPRQIEASWLALKLDLSQEERCLLDAIPKGLRQATG
jgi:aryl-alcohol dehydrogenase-like predicted oxidoreductase